MLVTLVDDNIRELTETFQVLLDNNDNIIINAMTSVYIILCQVSFDVDDVVILAGSITHTTVSIIDSDSQSNLSHNIM